MNVFTLILIVISLATFVAGQLLLKSSLNNAAAAPATERWITSRRAGLFTAGIVGMTISFFLNIGLLQKLDLSFLFPFQGLSVIIVTICACIFLRERLTIPLVAGALLIAAGVMCVSASGG
jgi:undecaprenyl phosphate-alpha-L-ara4N flippase subunit ArnE